MGLRGPYNAGFLLGRKDLIAAARLNGPPKDDCIGRGMKVSKEGMLGVMVALEKTLKFDNEADLEKKMGWVKLIAEQVALVPGVETEVLVTKYDGHQPHVWIKWDESKVKIAPAELVEQLREGEPSIEVCSFMLTDGRFELNSWMMKEGEAEIAARRVREVLQERL